MTLFQQMSNQHKTVLVFSLAACSYVFLFLFADGVAGGGDTYTHFFMSKYAGDHPELFLNQWGKPVFTTLFFPIAQLGFKAVLGFNLMLIFAQAGILFKIAQKLNLQQNWLIPFLFFTTPVIFENAISALTEILFGMMVISFLYLSLTKRIILSFLAISWLPFVRSEGFIFILIIALYYIVNRKWKYLPFLLFGTIVINSMGWYLSGEPLWLFSTNPYVNTAITAYGSGSFFHFFLWGIPVFGLGFIILLLQSWNFFKSERWFQNAFRSDFLSWHAIRIWFVYGFFWSFFFAHVVLWWQGMWASLGLTRVMFCIVGPFVLIIHEKIFSTHGAIFSDGKKTLKWWGIVAILSPLLASSMILERVGFPTGFGTEERIINQAIEELRLTNNLKEHETVYFAHPYFAVPLNRDPFNSEQSMRIEYYPDAKSGDWILWDGHFAPNEHETPLSKLINDTTLIQIGAIIPNRIYKPLNDIPFEIHVFRRK